jgi:hypothetical protein
MAAEPVPAKTATGTRGVDTDRVAAGRRGRLRGLNNRRAFCQSQHVVPPSLIFLNEIKISIIQKF